MSEYDMNKHDVVIIGGGLAGLRSAIESLSAGLDVAVISKVFPLRSHSVAAQGGINAALGNAEGADEDNWKNHAFDTIKGSDYLADQDAVEQMCREAPGAVIDLEHMGTVFSRLANGKIAQRPFGGAGFPRTCYAADRTGHNLLHTLFEQAFTKNIKFYDEYFAISLVVENGCSVGCVTVNIADGQFHGFNSKAIILATGGFGRVFDRSTNAVINTGDGAALAYRAGVPLKDMEFVQFHPTTLYGTNILITEGARGEGGYLYNNKHERFMKNYAEGAMELAPRDIVARSIQREIDSGRGFKNEFVHLDLTHLGSDRINERLPGIRQISMDFAGVDPVEKPIPIQPGQHYSMGGISTDKTGATELPGLFAAGECACVSVHGANRLGGNSLLEAVVFGKIVGATAAEYAKTKSFSGKTRVENVLTQEMNRIEELLSRNSGESIGKIKEELRKVMFSNFGIFRDEKNMKTGLEKLKELQKRFLSVHIDYKGKIFNQALIYALELEGMLQIAETAAIGALERKESRGSHYRNDYEKRDDDNFLKHSMVYSRNGTASLEYSNVQLGLFPVKERVY